MKREKKAGRRRLGRISEHNKGSAGFNMEAQGLWTKPGLMTT